MNTKFEYGRELTQDKRGTVNQEAAAYFLHIDEDIETIRPEKTKGDPQRGHHYLHDDVVNAQSKNRGTLKSR